LRHVDSKKIIEISEKYERNKLALQ